MMVVVGGVGLTSAPRATAQWYASGSAGSTTLSDSDFTDTFTAGNATGEVDFDRGLGLAAAVGHAWGNFRAEGEISYRKNDLDQVTVDTITVAGVLFTGLGTFDMEGDYKSLGFMANGWYDFDTGGNWVPFIGGGLGVAKLSLDIESIAGIATVYDESDTVVAYQFGAGIGFKVTPTVTVNLAYRILRHRRLRARRRPRQGRGRIPEPQHHGRRGSAVLRAPRSRRGIDTSLSPD